MENINWFLGRYRWKDNACRLSFPHFVVFCVSHHTILYTKLKLHYIHIFAYSLRMDIPICIKLGMLMPWDREKISERSEVQKLYWVQVPVWVVYVPQKLSKHDTRTVLKSKLFILVTRLQEQRLQPQKSPGFKSLFSVVWTCDLGFWWSVHNCRTNSFFLLLGMVLLGKCYITV
jgi:hypothetical protein